MSSRKLVLLLTVFSSVGHASAQRAAIAPLVPVVPSVAAPPLGLPLDFAVSSQFPVRPTILVLDQPPRIVRPQPVFLLNSRFIIGGGLGHLNPQDIANIDVYKGPSAPAKWRSLTTNGIIAITLKPHTKPKFKTKSLAAIGRELRLRGAVSYQLEGLPIEDLSLRVATADIARLDTQPTASGTVVNIHLALPPPVVHPPGTILIRGASGS
jgi:hypothetical protein